MSIDHGKVLGAGVERLRQALKMHNEHRTTLQSLASSVGDFLREYVALAQPAEAVLDRPARVAGRDFHPGQPVQQVIGRANAHYNATHDAAHGAVAWYVFADTEKWVTLDRSEADDQRAEGCQVRPLIFGDTHPQAAPAQGDGWKHISTMPKDGGLYEVLHKAGSTEIGGMDGPYFHDGSGWRSLDQFTHWREVSTRAAAPSQEGES